MSVRQLDRAVRSWYDIDGWFRWVDCRLFQALLTAQAESDPGTLVELGCYLGKSTVVIGDHRRAGEDFVVVDLFGDTSVLDGDDQATRAETDKSYNHSLTRERFEANYLALHDELPTVVQAPSSTVVDHVADGSVRFLHIDASHLYPHVIVDARNAARLLRPGGVVVFDDWRAEHTPGVAAAVWEAVATLGLIPVALTPTKFYGCFSAPDVARSAVEGLLAEHPNQLWSEVQEISGHPVRRISQRSRPAESGKAAKQATVAAEPQTAPPATTSARLRERDIERLAQRIAQLTAKRSAELVLDGLDRRITDEGTIRGVTRRVRQRFLPRSSS